MDVINVCSQKYMQHINPCTQCKVSECQTWWSNIIWNLKQPLHRWRRDTQSCGSYRLQPDIIRKINPKSVSNIAKLCGIPAVLIECENITLVLNASNTVDVLVFGSKDLIFHITWSAAMICVLWAIVPQQWHHHLSYTTRQHTYEELLEIRFTMHIFWVIFHSKNTRTDIIHSYPNTLPHFPHHK